jgi:hypothetical protein
MLVALTGACNSESPRKRIVVGARTENFRVLYRVVHTETKDAPSVAWEVLTVKRPFHSSDLTYKQRPDLSALGDPDSGTITDIDHLYSHDGTSLRAIAGRQPGLGSGDQALLSIANDAVARGRARIKGTTTVAGRTCTTLQFVEPPVGALAPFNKSKDHDDICIDRGGVILREQWTLRGRVVVTREAVQFAAASDDAFDVSNAEQVTGVPIPRVAAMDDSLAPPPAPPGYAQATAVDFFLPRADAPTQLAYASKVWAFSKGADFITVELGAGQVIPWDASADKTLRLGARAAGSVVRSDGIEIHWDSGNHWMRVRGPMSLAKLLAYARQVSSWDSSAAADVPR